MHAALRQDKVPCVTDFNRDVIWPKRHKSSNPADLMKRIDIVVASERISSRAPLQHPLAIPCNADRVTPEQRPLKFGGYAPG
jgi:hypothetical protein